MKNKETEVFHEWRFRNWNYGFIIYMFLEIIKFFVFWYLFCLLGLYLFKKININFPLTILGVLYLVLYVVWFKFVGGFNYLRISWKVKYILNHIVETNNFYTIEKYNSTDLHGKDVKKKKKTNFPKIQYFFDDDLIIIKFRLDGSKQSLKYDGLEEQITNAFNLPSVSAEIENGFAVYKLARTKAKTIIIDDGAIGMREDKNNNDEIAINSKLSWNYRKQPHALVTGITGGGKTYLLAYFIRMFLSYNADIKILDPKRSDLSFLEKYFGKDVVYEPNHIARILRESVKTMNTRYDEFKTLKNYAFGKDFKDYGYKPLFIIFDEVTAFMASADSKIVKEVNSFLTEIILKGRQAGVFMILTTQRADADYIKANIRDQLGLRIGLGRMSSSGYTMTFGSEYNDLHLNGSEKGVGFIFIDGVTDKPIQFESPYLTDKYDFIKDIEKLVSNKS